MAFEDIEIRISRDGKIYVTLDGCTEEQISNYRQFLEDNVGPVLEMETVRKPDWDHPASLSNEDVHQREQEQRRR